MARYLFLMSFLIFLVSCYNENKPPVEKPDPLFSNNQMIEIMTDVQLAEGIIALHRKENDNLSDGYNDTLFQVVFDQHEITKEQLTANIHYYNNQPKVMEKIMDQVLVNLSMQQTDIKLKAAAAMDTISASERLRIEDEKEAEIK